MPSSLSGRWDQTTSALHSNSHGIGLLRPYEANRCDRKSVTTHSPIGSFRLLNTSSDKLEGSSGVFVPASPSPGPFSSLYLVSRRERVGDAAANRVFTPVSPALD